MAGQAKVTIARAAALEKEGWKVVYKSVPNTAHSGVVPITTAKGTKQRYPDILSVSGDKILLSEVEQYLTEGVAAEIALRLTSHIEALSNETTYSNFRERIKGFHGIELPAKPAFEKEMVLCNIPGTDALSRALRKTLGDGGVNLVLPPA